VKDQIFLFSYFKGHGDGLHLAVSDNGYSWKALNDDCIFIKPEAGIEKIMRDPCLILGHDDVFHLVWTAGWNEKGIGYCYSKNLVEWSPQHYLPVMEHEEKARNCWAPEILYDSRQCQYMIYWATTIDGKFPETQAEADHRYNHRMYYVTTKDFKRFSETKLLYNQGFNVIDGTIVQNGESFLMFMKNETAAPPQKNILFARGNDPLCLGMPGTPITPPQYWAEGPTAVKIDNDWIVYFDKYKINQIGAVKSKDLVQWEDISHQLSFPEGAQHGYVSNVPRSKLQHLLT
jgi:beta-xylosidase